MDNSESRPNERLDIPLLAQAPSVPATARGSIVAEFKSLIVLRKSGWTPTLPVIDAASQRRVYDFILATCGTHKTLLTPDGRPLLSLKDMDSYDYCIYEGDDRDHGAMEVRVEHLPSDIISVDVRDRVFGRPCRIVLDGNLHDSVAIFYIEYGEPKLLSVPTVDDLMDAQRFYTGNHGEIKPGLKHPARAPRYQPIGRVRRPLVKAFAPQKYYIEAAPGVDITLLVMVWRAWEEVRVHRALSEVLAESYRSCE